MNQDKLIQVTHVQKDDQLSDLIAFSLFADNTKIYYESKDSSNLTKHVNKELRLVKKWFDAYKLSLNIDNTN